MYLIANWKMYISYRNSCSLLKEYQTLEYDHQKISLVVCPSYESLAFFHAQQPAFFWGAQNCSAQELGSYTGQVSIPSLKQLGCSYSLIGHYECRTFLHETTPEIYSKYQALCAQRIKPIFCIGHERHTSWQETAEQLHEQLAFIKDHKNLILAYEPYWAIGSKDFPAIDFLQQIVKHLKSILDPSTTILYGGSVDPHALEYLPLKELFDGFLIGKASTDFQAFKKIVLSVS